MVGKISPMSSTPFPERLYCRARLAGKIKYEPNWLLPERTISDNELVYVLKGKGTFWIGERESGVSAGDCLILLPRIAHRAATIKTDPFQLIFVHFDLFLDGKKYALHNRRWAEVINIPGGLNIDGALLDVVTEFEQKQTGWETVINGLILQVLTKVYRWRHQVSLSPVNARLIDKVRPAIRHMQECFAEECRVSALAKLVHLHPVYFSRVFKQATGVSPQVFLRRLRIQKAKAYILNTDSSFTEIAAITGFNSIHYFSRIFKQTEGLTPSQYLRSANRL